MTQEQKQFRFQAVLTPVKHNFVRNVVLLPEDVVKRLPGGRLRVKGTMNGVPFALAVQNFRDGSRYFSVGASLRKAVGVKADDKIEIKFRVVDSEVVDIPEELEALLDQDDEASLAWKKLTKGHQRGLIHYITSVKNVDSRIKRAIDIMERAKVGKLHGQKKKET